MKRLWITRAAPGAGATAARVRAMGHEAIVAPVLEVRFLPAEIDLAGIGALAFTSANGVRAFAAASGERGMKVFAVGAATARAAREAGFRGVLSADGDVAALAAAIARRARELGGAVLHPGAADPAGDLAADLTRRGVGARAVTLYETVAAEIPAELVERVAALDGVIVHSPRAGARVAEILRGVSAPGLAAYCLSAEVAAAVEGLAIGPVLAATLPNEDALLNLIV